MPFRLNVKAVSMSQTDTNIVDDDVPIATIPDVCLTAQAQKNTEMRKACYIRSDRNEENLCHRKCHTLP